MSKPTTNVLIVTDRSGSMASLAADVRGGFNAYVDGLRADSGKYRLTATLFDTESTALCVGAKLRDVPALTEANYRPGGMTALLDAVGKTVAEFEARTTLGDGDRVLVVIQTDGAENSSREYSWEQVQRLIKDREATGKWSFVYLGAGADTWDQASRMGVAASNYVNTGHSSGATQSTYSGLTRATVAYSKGATGAEASGIVAATPGVTGS